MGLVPPAAAGGWLHPPTSLQMTSGEARGLVCRQISRLGGTAIVRFRCWHMYELGAWSFVEDVGTSLLLKSYGCGAFKLFFFFTDTVKHTHILYIFISHTCFFITTQYISSTHK